MKTTVFLLILLFAIHSIVLAEDIPSSKFDEVVVTATKTESTLADLPVTVYTVDNEDIQYQPNYFVSNFGELIRDLPGIHVAQYFPWGPPWVHFRGTGYFIGRSAYMVDGVPVSPFLSTPVNNNDIERIEVLLGPSSALYGANAMGGVLNIITKKGTKDTGAKFDVGYGTHNTWRPHVAVGNKIGNFHFYASYSGDYSDGYKMNPFDVVWDLYKSNKKQWLSYASLDDNEYRHSFYNTKIGWENDKGQGFWIDYHHQDMYLNGGRDNRILQDDGNEGIATFRFYSPIGSNIKLIGTVGYQYLDRPSQEDKGAKVSGTTVSWDNTPSTRSEWENKRYPLELQGDFHIGKNNVLTAGIFWLRDEEMRAVKNAQTGATTSKSEYTTDQTALYIQNQSFLIGEKLVLLTGLRYDHWKYHNIFDLLSTPQKPDPVDHERFTYRGALKYKLNEKLAFRVSGGTGFWPGLPVWFFQNTRSGSAWREANPNLKPEKTWMVDLGLELALTKWGSFITVTPYYGEISDVVSYKYDQHPTQSGVSIIRTENLGGAEIYGVEIGIDQYLTRNFSIAASLTLNHSEIVDDPLKEGNQLRNAPDYWGSIVLKYKNPEIFNGRIALRYSDDRYYDDENTELPYYHMRDYAVVDAKIWKDWRIMKNGTLTVSLSGENIFDKEYETEIVYMHPGASFMANIGFKYYFNK